MWVAAERICGFNAENAAALFLEALELTPPGHPDRGRLLTASVESSVDGHDARVEVLDEAIEELRAAGDEVGLGKAMAIQSRELWRRGESAERGLPLLADARALLERHEPGPELAYVLSLAAATDIFLGRSQDALELAERGLALAERLHLQDLVLRNRQWLGLARCDQGEVAGLDDLRESLELALELGFSTEAAHGYSNYASSLWLAVSPEAALEVYEQGAEFLVRRRHLYEATWQRAELTKILFDLGRWDELLAAGREVEEQTADQPLLVALTTRALVLLYRGARADAAELARDVLPRARGVGDSQIVVPALSLAALVEDDASRFVTLVEELVSFETTDNPLYPDVARACIKQGRPDLAERMIRTDRRASTRGRHVSTTVNAILAEARGERAEAAALYGEAAERWREYPFVLERALCLIGAGRPAEGEEILRSLGAESLLVAA
jgi:tetratricopeptide (TPR) repeat protein